MIQPKEQEIREKYRSLPKVLQSILNSPVQAGTVSEINEKYDLSEEDSKVLAASVGLVLLGFIKPPNLFQEINEYLEADEKTVVEVIREVNRRILVPLHKELETLYKIEGHIEGELETGAKKELEAVIEIKKEPAEEPADAKKQEFPRYSPPEKEGQPLIIHKEESALTTAEDDKDKKKFKGFDFPFGVFEKEGGKKPPTEPVKVRVEGPGKKKLGKRVVHYSEHRTPLTPFGQSEEEIIDIPTLTRKEPPPKVPPKKEVKPAPQPKPEMKKEEPKGPSIEGNTIDLKNF